MTARPRIQPGRTLTDLVLETAGFLLLTGMWVYVVASYSELPDRIPVHYNIHGKADAFGGKNNVFTIPVIATLLFAGLCALNRFPHLFNYPKPITPENALNQYSIMSRMMRVLNLVILGVFAFISWRTISHSENSEMISGPWFVIIITAMPLLPVVYYTWRSIRQK